MSNKREHKRQKKAEKKKARDRERQKEAADKRESDATPRGVPGRGATLAQAAEWPVHEAWASAGWPEQGAHAHAAITRLRDDGRIAAAFFELDLAARGVLSVKASASWNADRVIAEVGRRSSEDDAMMQVDPEVVVKLVQAARSHGESGGHEQARGLDEAIALFEGIDPDTYRGEILVGEPESEPEPERSGGVFGAIWRYLFGPADPDDGADQDEVQTIEDFVYNPDEAGEAVLDGEEAGADDLVGDDEAIGDHDTLSDADTVNEGEPVRDDDTISDAETVGDEDTFGAVLDEGALVEDEDEHPDAAHMDAALNSVRAEPSKPKRYWTATPSPAAAVSNPERRSLLPREPEEED